MHAGLPKYVPVNLKDIETAGFQEGEEVSLETLKKKGLINPSGRERRLPLKVQMILLYIIYWLQFPYKSKFLPSFLQSSILKFENCGVAPCLLIR
jgi:hypothetical protein